VRAPDDQVGMLVADLEPLQRAPLMVDVTHDRSRAILAAAGAHASRRIIARQQFNLGGAVQCWRRFGLAFAGRCWCDAETSSKKETRRDAPSLGKD